MDEPRWILEVPIPGSDEMLVFPFTHSESLARTLMEYARDKPNLDTFLTWNW